MTATTAANVTLTDTGWTQISTATIHTLQVLRGKAGIIYAVSQPAASVKAPPDGIGIFLTMGDFWESSVGGTAWGRASELSNNALIAVTEDV